MAVKYQGGQAVRMQPLGKDQIARLHWLRNREIRLKDQLRTGELEQAAQTLSEILESAKPGDYNVTKAEALRNAMRAATEALNKVRSAYGGSLIN